MSGSLLSEGMEWGIKPPADPYRADRMDNIRPGNIPCEA